MLRKILVFSSLSLVSTAIGAQILVPVGPKPMTKPTVPVKVMPVTPVTTAPVGPVTANRTVELLKNAGIINPTNIDQPVHLTPRAPYIDDLTYLAVAGGDYVPKRNLIGIRGPENGVTSSWAEVSWNAMPDRRYVLDCGIGSPDGLGVTFTPAGGSQERVRVAGGRAGVVLPVGAQPPVRVMLDVSQVLSGCDITPFGS
ncbi:MAG TPA: hypothetical protein VJP82_05640 [Sphingomicrobium sp.]|jgi:hypothetical protein|nr:hypothetical protein [Sphingomicrobium sp.]